MWMCIYVCVFFGVCLVLVPLLINFLLLSTSPIRNSNVLLLLCVLSFGICLLRFSIIRTYWPISPSYSPSIALFPHFLEFRRRMCLCECVFDMMPLESFLCSSSSLIAFAFASSFSFSWSHSHSPSISQFLFPSYWTSWISHSTFFICFRLLCVTIPSLLLSFFSLSITLFEICSRYCEMKWLVSVVVSHYYETYIPKPCRYVCVLCTFVHLFIEQANEPPTCLCVYICEANIPLPLD